MAEGVDFIDKNVNCDHSDFKQKWNKFKYGSINFDDNCFICRNEGCVESIPPVNILSSRSSEPLPRSPTVDSPLSEQTKISKKSNSLTNQTSFSDFYVFKEEIQEINDQIESDFGEGEDCQLTKSSRKKSSKKLTKVSSLKEVNFDELSETDKMKEAKKSVFSFKFLRAHRFKHIKYSKEDEHL